MPATPMQEMFDLNTAIDQLKNEASKSWNFEVKPSELECQIHIFAQTDSFPQVVQNEFLEFNDKVRKMLNDMIDKLIDERDSLTMQILQKNYQTMNDIHDETVDNALGYLKEIDKAYEELNQLTSEEQCDGIDCDTCHTDDCTEVDKPSK